MTELYGAGADMVTVAPRGTGESTVVQLLNVELCAGVLGQKDRRASGKKEKMQTRRLWRALFMGMKEVVNMPNHLADLAAVTATNQQSET